MSNPTIPIEFHTIMIDSSASLESRLLSGKCKIYFDIQMCAHCICGNRSMESRPKSIQLLKTAQAAKKHDSHTGLIGCRSDIEVWMSMPPLAVA